MRHKTAPGEQIATGHQKTTSTSKSLTSATQNSKHTGSPATLNKTAHQTPTTLNKTAHQTPTTQSPTLDEKPYNDAITSTDTYTFKSAYVLLASGKDINLFNDSPTRQSLGKEDAVGLRQNDTGGDSQTNRRGTVLFMALFKRLNSSLDIHEILKTLEVHENKNLHSPVHALLKLLIVSHNKPLVHSAKSSRLSLIKPIDVVAGLNKLSLKYYNQQLIMGEQQDVRRDQEIIHPTRNLSRLYRFRYYAIAWIFVQLFAHFLEERERGEPRIVVIQEELIFVLARLFLLGARNYGRRVPISGGRSGGSGCSIGGMQSGNSDELLQGGRQSGGISSGGFGGGSSGGGGGREGGDGGSDREEGEGVKSGSNEDEEEEETRRRKKKKHGRKHRKPKTRDEFQTPEEAQNPAPIPSPENVVAPPRIPAEMLHILPETTHQPRLEPTSPPDDEPVEHFHELMPAENPSPQLEDPTLQPQKCAAEGNVQPLEVPRLYQDVAHVAEPPPAAEGITMEVVAPRKDLPRPEPPSPKENVKFFCANKSASMEKLSLHGASHPEPRSSHHLDSNSNHDDSGNEHEGICADDELVSGRRDPKRDGVNSEEPHPAQEEGDVPSGACGEQAPSTLSHFTQQVSQTDETVQPAVIVNGEPVSEAEEGSSSNEEENEQTGQ